MTMFGPWYDPRDDMPTQPWPGFDLQRLVPFVLGAVLAVVPLLLALLVFVIMRSAGT